MELEKAWKITEFSKLVGKHYNTVDQWFKHLEDKNYHYVNRIAGEKVYNELDLEIARYIKECRDNDYALQIIFEQLGQLYDLRPFPEGWSTGNPLLDIESMRRAMEQQFDLKFEEAKEELLTMATRAAQLQMEEQNKALLQLLPPEKTQEELRQERAGELLTKFKIDNALEKKAIEEWEKLPETTRFKKAGLFRKEIDVIKRDEFIRKYKEDHYEEYIRKEFS